MANSFKKSVEDFVRERIIRLWPVMAFSILIFGIFKIIKWLPYSLNSSDYATLLFLQGTGVSQGANANGPAWFVCVLFWCSIIYFIYLKMIANKKILQVVSMLFIFILTIRLYTKYVIGMGYTMRDVVDNYMSIGMLCGLAFVSLGILFSFVNQGINHLFKGKLAFNEISPIFKFIFTGIEIAILIFLCIFCFHNCNIIPYPYNPTLIALLFGVLLISFVNKSGYISYRILNSKKWDFFGNTSYAVYIMQNFIFVVIFHYCSIYPDFIRTHVLDTTLVCLLLFNLAGWFAYYAVEKPITSMYKNIKRLHDEFSKTK